MRTIAVTALAVAVLGTLTFGAASYAGDQADQRRALRDRFVSDAKGRSQGFTSGSAAGFRSGQVAGYADGSADGYEDGLNDGSDQLTCSDDPDVYWLPACW